MTDNKLPEGWQLIRLENVCTLRKEATYPNENLNRIYIGLEHIDSGLPYLTRTGLASEVKSSKSKFYKGDVLYGKLRPYLDKVVLAEYDGICSTDILVLISDDLVLSQFLVYFMHTSTFLSYAIKTTKGVNHPRTSWTSLAKFELSLPPLPEQHAISQVLQTLQKTVEIRRQEMALEKERKAALMQHLFTHGTRGEARKMTKIGEVPESWHRLPLSQVAEIVYGVQAAVAKLLDESKGIPILTNINITNEGNLDLSTLRYYELPEKKRKTLILQTGDILFNWRSGSQKQVGKTAIFNLEGEYTFSSFILRFRASEAIFNKFLFYYLQQLKLQGYFTQNRQQSSVNSVFNASVAAKIQVAIPELIEQHEIVEVLQACDKKIATLEKEIALLDEFFKSMLEELMTGRQSALGLND